MPKHDQPRVLYDFGHKVIEQIAQNYPQVEFQAIPAEGGLDADVRGDVMVTTTLGNENLAEVLTRGVEWVHVVGTGVDRFPQHLLSDQVLTCARGASARPIAEWTLAHILAFEKRLPNAWVSAKPDTWFFPTEPAGTLAGKRLAIVGLGAIAHETARRALAFDMEIMALRRTAKPAQLPEIAVTTSLEELAAGADHLLVACALTPETEQIADADFFAQLKPGAHFINVARGECVDETALRAALDDGTVARASLDTASGEPLPADHWMFGHPGVYLTPHISWSEPGALEQLFSFFDRNLQSWLDDEPLFGVVDLEAGY